MRLRLGPAAALLSIYTVPKIGRPRTRPLVSLSRGAAWELPPTWLDALTNIQTTAEFGALQEAVEDERSQFDVLPCEKEQFAAFEACAFGDVRVVLLGQDPYPTPGHAMGLSFSVRPGVTPPASLKNIFTELERDLGVPSASHGCLDAWAAQGVFLLNSALTVRAREAGSHSKLGWSLLTDAAIEALSSQRNGLVFLLWGAAAQSKAKLIDSTRHCVLTAPHPSPLSAYRGFFGCGHFSKTNSYLVAHGLDPIDWALPRDATINLLGQRPGAAEQSSSHDAPAETAASSLVTSSKARVSDALILIFDTETTGVDVAQDRVVQLGAVYWRGSKMVGPPRGMLVNPLVPIPSGATAVHGVTDGMVASAPQFDQVAARFVPHLRGEATPGQQAPPVLCGYNAIEYDVPLLNTEFDRHGVAHRIDPASVLDPLVWIRWHKRHWRKRDLESCARAYGFEHSQAHAASADAYATGVVLSGLLLEGLLPDEVEDALAEQARLRAITGAEWAEYGYALYVDRTHPQEGLRLGFGKGIGARLRDAEPSTLQFYLDQFHDLTEPTREAFEAVLRGESPLQPTWHAALLAERPTAEEKHSGKTERAPTQRQKSRPSKRASATDQFSTAAEKLAFRMREGMFSVIDVDTHGDVDWPPLEVSGSYAVKPGRGGMRYLANVADRLQEIGFRLDPSTNIWLRSKQLGLLDVTTLEPIDDDDPFKPLDHEMGDV